MKFTDQHLVLNGLNHDVLAGNDIFTFQKLENDKKIYVDGFICLAMPMYRRHLAITASSEMCPIPNLLLIGENIIIFSNKVLSAYIKKNTRY